MTPFYETVSVRGASILAWKKTRYRKSRGSARVAEKGTLSGALSLLPSELLELGEFGSILDQLIDGRELLGGRLSIGELFRYLQEVNTILGDPRRLGSFQRYRQQRETGEEHLCP